MANRTLPMNDALHAYLLEVSVDEPEVMRRLREDTAARENAAMQIGPEQGAFMAWLVRLIGARRALEVGTFTGYSALSVARALPADGRLVCCELNADYVAAARPYWEEAGVAARIEVRLGAAVDSLRALRAEGAAGTFDFAFVDADKPSYDAYYEACLELLRPGGLVALDNVLWGGAVADPSDARESTVALRRLNAEVFADPRVDATLVPIGDGLTLARKR
jgi:predicted O-methyltransferase YrrM